MQTGGVNKENERNLDLFRKNHLYLLNVSGKIKLAKIRKYDLCFIFYSKIFFILSDNVRNKFKV